MLFNFFVPKSECFTKSDAFCLYIFDYACLGHKGLLLSKRFEIMEKLYSSKTCLKMAGGGMRTPQLALITMSLTTIHYANQPIWLQYDVGQFLTQLC